METSIQTETSSAGSRGMSSTTCPGHVVLALAQLRADSTKWNDERACGTDGGALRL